MNFLFVLFVFLAFQHANASIFKFREEYAEFDGGTVYQLKIDILFIFRHKNPGFEDVRSDFLAGPETTKEVGS